MLPKFDFHVHTIYSDGSAPPERIVEIAEKRGLKAVAITDHGPGLSVGAEPSKFLILAQDVRVIREETEIQVLAGVESNITPDGNLDMGEEILRELDLVTAGVHYLRSGNCEEQAMEYMRVVRKALQSHKFDVLVHPLYYNKYLLPWIPPEDIEEFIQELARAGVAVELNSKYHTPDKTFIQDCLLYTSPSPRD